MLNPIVLFVQAHAGDQKDLRGSELPKPIEFIAQSQSVDKEVVSGSELPKPIWPAGPDMHQIQSIDAARSAQSDNGEVFVPSSSLRNIPVQQLPAMTGGRETCHYMPQTYDLWDNDWSGYDGGFYSSGTVIGDMEYKGPCVEGVTPVTPAGTYSSVEYAREKGRVRLQCVGWTPDSHEQARAFSSKQERCKNEGETDYDELALAVGMFPGFLGFNDLYRNQMELASFFAHTSIYSGSASSTADWWGYSWCDTEDTKSSDFGSQDDLQRCGYAAPPESTEESRASRDFGYYGRGLLEMQWCFNYFSFGTWLKNLGVDKYDGYSLLEKPSVVADRLAWASAVWRWMSADPHNYTPSLHSVVQQWKEDVVDLPIDNAFRRLDFGYQVNILAGDVECGSNSKSGSVERKTQMRVDYLLAFMEILGMDPFEQKPFISLTGGCIQSLTLNQTNFKYAYFEERDWPYDALDSKNGGMYSDCENMYA